MDKVVFKKDELIKTLQENASVEVRFTKKSTGEDRIMLCTLNNEVLAADGARLDAPKTERKSPEHLVHVYDLEASAWRSFDINTVYAVSI